MGKSKGAFGPGPDEASPAGSTPPPNAITAAARNAVAELFDELAVQWPRILKSEINTETGPQDPKFTQEMVETMRDQLRRALGLPPGKAKGE